uniref:CUB domain-containing protein n=1 Tax=Kryptolebias marmoratus TaxID=37003 RepID=A0A3Q3AQV3_KRYMA
MSELYVYEQLVHLSTDGQKGDNSAFFALRSCHQLLRSDNGEFFSPDYLCSNPPLWCNWTIWVEPGKRIHLRLEDLTPDDSCQLKQDQIHVDEPTGHSGGHKVLQKCWQEAKYTSSSNTLYVVLLIGGWPSTPYRGFYGRYQAFGPPVVYNPQEGFPGRSKVSEPSAGLTDFSDFESVMNRDQTKDLQLFVFLQISKQLGTLHTHLSLSSKRIKRFVQNKSTKLLCVEHLIICKHVKKSKVLGRNYEEKKKLIYEKLINSVTVKVHVGFVCRLNAGALYILWLQIGQGPGGMQIHRAVHSAMQGLLATGVNLRVSHQRLCVCVTDVNECGTQLVLCDVNADCVNHFGTYSCHCRPGFQDESRLGSGGTICMKAQAAGCSGLSSETKGVYVLFFLLSSLILMLLVVAGTLYHRHHRGAFLVHCHSSNSISPPDPNNNHLHPNENYSTPTDCDLPPPPPPRCPPMDLTLLRFNSLLPPDSYIDSQDSGKM